MHRHAAIAAALLASGCLGPVLEGNERGPGTQCSETLQCGPGLTCEQTSSLFSGESDAGCIGGLGLALDRVCTRTCSDWRECLPWPQSQCMTFGCATGICLVVMETDGGTFGSVATDGGTSPDGG